MKLIDAHLHWTVPGAPDHPRFVITDYRDGERFAGLTMDAGASFVKWRKTSDANRVRMLVHWLRVAACDQGIPFEMIDHELYKIDDLDMLP